MTVLTLAPARDGDALAQRITADLARRAARFADAAARTHACADDEAVHDLRVSARRLEAALDLWRSVLDPRARRRARRTLRRLRREAGPVREHEVHRALLRERLEVLDPEDRVAVERVLQRLDRRVDRDRRALARRVTPARVERLVRRVERAVHGAAAAPRGPHDPLAAPAERLARRRTRALESMLTARPTLEDEALHAARIALKRWRYAEEAMAVGRDEPRGPSTRGLRALQEALGEVHDRAVLRDLLLREGERLRGRGEAHAAAALASLGARIEAARVEAVLRFRSAAGPLLDAG
jgi:CHAD domain-containing protein